MPCTQVPRAPQKKKKMKSPANFSVENRQNGTMATIDPETAAQYGLTVNSNQGTYRRGLAYRTGKKLEVAEVYKSHTDTQ